MDESYFKRIEAIEFAAKYDDGKDRAGLKSDITLIGIAYVEHALSMYLANRGYRVPIFLVPEVDPPAELHSCGYPAGVWPVADPRKLNSIRSERPKALKADDAEQHLCTDGSHPGGAECVGAADVGFGLQW